MIRVPLHDLAPAEREIELEATQSRYLSRVHRLRSGDAFIAFDPKHGVECDAELLSARRARLGALRAAATLPARAVTWIHGCPKGDKADAIVRDATELGATRIVMVATERSVARPSAARTLRWARIAEQAAGQSGRGDAHVVLEATWSRALDVSADVRICLDPRGEPLRDVLSMARGSLAFAAGPEGGLTEDELGVARERGFTVRRLGTLVLRTETVPAAVLGAAALFL
jgi:16S rRNA (uracil1498-N3)-methyltransferase